MVLNYAQDSAVSDDGAASRDIRIVSLSGITRAELSGIEFVERALYTM
jgi:hypothetical protein